MLLAIFPGVIRGALKYPQLSRRRLPWVKAVRTQMDHISVVMQEILPLLRTSSPLLLNELKSAWTDGANVSLKISHRSKPIR